MPQIHVNTMPLDISLWLIAGFERAILA